MSLLRTALITLAALIAATGAHAQIAFRSAAFAPPAAQITHVGAGAVRSRDDCGSITPPIPAGNVADLLIATVNVRNADAVVATPAGWTQLYAGTYPGNVELKAFIFYRIAAGGDTLTVTQSGSCFSIAGIVSRFRNVDTAQPFLNVPIPAPNVAMQTANFVNTGTETTIDANAMLLVATFLDDNVGITAGGGWNASFEHPLDVSRDLALNLHYQLQSTAGAKAISNWALTGPNIDSIGIIFSLRPAAPGLQINRPAGTVTNDVMIASIAVASLPRINLITHVGAGAVRSRDDCGSITPPIPAGNVGDLLITMVNVRNADAVVATPAGWTQLYAGTYPGNAELKAFIFYRIAAGGDTLTVTQSGSCYSIAGIVSRFRNVDTAQPFLNVPIPAPNVAMQTANFVNTGTETTIDANAMLLVATFLDDNVGITAGGGWNASFEHPLDVSRDLALNLHYQLQSTAGAKAISNWALTSDSIKSIGIIFSLRSVAPTYPAPVTLTPPAGWTLVQRTNNTSTNPNSLAVYMKAAGATEPASYTWSLSAVTGVTGGIQSFVGVDNAAPIDVQNGQNTASGLAHATPSVTTTVNLAMLVTSHAYSSAATWTPPAGMAQGFAASSLATPNPAGVSIQGNYGLQASAGATGAKTATAANDADVGNAHILALRPVAGLNHFAISHAGSGVGCVDQPITITAHSATHNPVDAYALTVNLSATNGKGTWTGIQAGGGVLNDPVAGDGAATYTFAVGSNSVTLLFRYANLSAATETFGFNVSGGGYSETTGTASGSDDPSFTMSQAGFRFLNIEDANEIIPLQLSGKPSNTGFNARTIRLQAVNTDTSSGACTNLFASQAQTVELGAECNNPATCTPPVDSVRVSVNGTSIPTRDNNGAAGAAAYFGVPLNFNASSAADTVIVYPDAGEISLHARFDLNPLVPGSEMVGSSNNFVVRPFGLAFPGVSHSNTAAGALIGAAGDNFAMTVQAYRWASGEDANNDGVPDAGAYITDNGTVPNFAATATVDVSANLPGIALGSVSRGAGCDNPASVAITGGAGAAADWCYSEVGNVILTAAVTNYLSAGINITGNSGLDGAAGGGYVGRFSPKRFELTGAPVFTPRFDASCAGPSSFAYLDEPIRLNGFGMQAINTQNSRTRNYDGAYALHVPDPMVGGAKAGFSIGARSGSTDYTSRISATHVLVPVWRQGRLEGPGPSQLEIALSFNRNATNTPDGRFAATGFGIAPTDSDNVRLPTYDLDVNNDATNDHLLVGSTDALFGRLVMQSVYGPNNRDLPVTLETQYWDGSQFTRNNDDSCTEFLQSDFALTFASPPPPEPNLDACETAMREANITFASGRATLTMANPGATNSGTVRLTANLDSAAGTYCPSVGAAAVAATNAAKGYLRGKWNDGAAYDDKPSAAAGFGLYGSQPKNFIFFRENY